MRICTEYPNTYSDTYPDREYAARIQTRIKSSNMRHISRVQVPIQTPIGCHICITYSNTYREQSICAGYWTTYLDSNTPALLRRIIRRRKSISTEYRSMYSNTFGAWIHGEYLHSYSENDSSAISWQYCVSKLDCIEHDIDANARKQIWNPHVQSQLIDGKIGIANAALKPAGEKVRDVKK